MNSNLDIDKEVRFGKLSITILIISVIVIIFSFFAPYLFVQESIFGIDFSDKGEIGDTLGGVMNPFIAISGVLLTFLAFYIQFRANRLQRKMFRLELDEQKIQFKKNQIENQFYEMLRLHKENVNEIEVSTIKFIFNQSQKEKVEGIIKGRRVFDFMAKEFEICYYTAKKCFPEATPKICINEAYGVFFHGLNNENKNKHEYFKILAGIKDNHEFDNYSDLKSIIKQVLNIEWEYDLNYELFKGYSTLLAHYYRHLFQSVKFVVNQPNNLINYEEKRKYLRILRAQLSNNEQLMLFYNWLSNFGKQWENNNNKFFTDYRMIHNIYQALIVPDIKLEELFNIDNDYLKEKNRDFDPLFEYQDWD